MAWLNYDITGKRIFIAGHTGMVGAALVRRFEQEDCTILTCPRPELDLLDQAAVHDWLQKEKPDLVIIAAGKSGSALANQNRSADFMYENLAISMHLIHGAYLAGVEKLINIAAPHIYPEMVHVPTSEHRLMSGPLDKAYESSATARLAALHLCDCYYRQYQKDFLTIVPAEIYGPGDNYDPLSGRVMPAFIRGAEEAKKANLTHMPILGHSTAVREFIYVDDFADALVVIIKHHQSHHLVNVGVRESITMADLFYKVTDIVGFDGQPKFLRKIPHGVAERFLSSSGAEFCGWRPKYTLDEGIEKAWQAYLKGDYREYDLNLKV
ncbi:NAD-dependent epimerase/dehydratase family protein [Thalassospira profundimaris]|nr:NAD-dependent epimerase/dehydratase family protein [Thalassospira profundimaris]